MLFCSSREETRFGVFVNKRKATYARRRNLAFHKIGHE